MSYSDSNQEEKSKAKGLKDLLSKVVFSFGESSALKEGSSSKELVNNLLSWAGKNRNEFIQQVSREAGTAIAKSLQPLLHSLLENKKISITIDLVDQDHVKKSEARTKQKKSKKVSQTRSSAKKVTKKKKKTTQRS